MKYLLDTNIVLILYQGREKEIRQQVNKIFENSKNVFFASAISLNEVIQLYRKRKMTGIDYKTFDTPDKLLKDIKKRMRNIKFISFKPKHSLKLATLNFILKHKDPNDLAIIAHAMSEEMTVISTDDIFPYYEKQGAKIIHNKRRLSIN